MQDGVRCIREVLLSERSYKLGFKEALRSLNFMDEPDKVIDTNTYNIIRISLLCPAGLWGWQRVICRSTSQSPTNIFPNFGWLTIELGFLKKFLDKIQDR